jgi:hypothetical protein
MLELRETSAAYDPTHYPAWAPASLRPVQRREDNTMKTPEIEIDRRKSKAVTFASVLCGKRHCVVAIDEQSGLVCGERACLAHAAPLAVTLTLDWIERADGVSASKGASARSSAARTSLHAPCSIGGAVSA